MDTCADTCGDTCGDAGDGRGLPGHLLPPLPAGRQHRQLQRLQQRGLHEVDGVSIRVSLSQLSFMLLLFSVVKFEMKTILSLPSIK